MVLAAAEKQSIRVKNTMHTDRDRDLSRLHFFGGGGIPPKV